VTIDVTAYLAWLKVQFDLLGGTIQIKTITHLNQIPTVVSAPVDAIVNCTGLGSRFLGGVEDLNVYAVRGQTLLCRPTNGKLLETVTRIAGMSFVVLSFM
jgi:glycine/D-amino acid oxidase-like deaminating enzyme